jgi:F-type H+-transporting ATPase subunit b
MTAMTRLTCALILLAGPAAAATGPFVSLRNTDFVVLLAFLGFIAVLIYFKVPGLLGGMLEKRADTIQSELDEARTLREEAQSLLVSYERKQRDVQAQADRIVDQAKKDAAAASEQAKKDLELSIARRMQAAEEQIAQAQASAVRDVRDQAVMLSVAAARDIMARGMSSESAASLIDASIDEVGTRLH